MNLLNQIVDYKWHYEDENYYYLYRHVPVDDYSLKNLTDGTFWFSSIDKFNDPFDCMFKNKGIPPIKEIKKIVEKKLGKKIKHTKFLEKIEEYKYRLAKANDADYARNFHEGTGIVCLNENPLGILMWSHYANSHSGFMMEFKFNKKIPELSQNFIVYPVIYADEYPIVEAYGDESEKIKTRFLYKSKEWSYEREFRIIRMNLIQENRAEKYPSYLLSSIVLGINISNENESKVRNALGEFSRLNNKVVIYKSEKLSDKYALTVPTHPRLDVLANSKNKK